MALELQEGAARWIIRPVERVKNGIDVHQLNSVIPFPIMVKFRVLLLFSLPSPIMPDLFRLGFLHPGNPGLISSSHPSS